MFKVKKGTIKAKGLAIHNPNFKGGRIRLLIASKIQCFSTSATPKNGSITAFL